MSQGFGRSRLLSRSRWSGAIVRKATAQTISNNSVTALIFDTEDFDTDGYHDNSTDNTRLTVKAKGVYLVTVAVDWDTAPAGARLVYLRTGGATTVATNAITTAFDGYGTNVSHVLSMGATEYVETMVYQNSGGDQSVAAYFTITKLG